MWSLPHVKDEVLNITTGKHARGKLVQRTINVADLVIPVDNHSMSDVSDLRKVLERSAKRGKPLTVAAHVVTLVQAWNDWTPPNGTSS